MPAQNIDVRGDVLDRTDQGTKVRLGLTGHFLILGPVADVVLDEFVESGIGQEWFSGRSGLPDGVPDVSERQTAHP
jgi:hypothetical protein